MILQISRLSIPDILIIKPNVYSDNRGHFFESYSERDFSTSGITARFVQDNQSKSSKGVIRGLHYQKNHPQGCRSRW